MKYIAESYSDIYKLAMMYVHDQITAEEYYEAVDIWADRMVKQESGHISWINTESIRGDRKSLWQRFKDGKGRVSS